MTDPAGRGPVPGPIVNALTVDVEDYFHVSAFESVVDRATWETMPGRVEGCTERLLDMFDEAGVRATFFVLGWVAHRYADLVVRIAGRGHELASHGYSHRLIYDQTPEAFREDVRRAKATIEDVSGQRVRGYRAPSFSVTPRSLWALDVLVEEGYDYDSSIYPIRHDRYGMPSAPRAIHAIDRPGGALLELPGTTVRVGPLTLPVAGGGYFRLLPYWWTRWGIEQVNRRERRPAMFYLHPWEIDPGQPRLGVGRVTAFRHYHNLDRTEGRLRRLLRDFRFDTVSTVLAQADVEAPRRVAVPVPS